MREAFFKGEAPARVEASSLRTEKDNKDKYVTSMSLSSVPPTNQSSSSLKENVIESYVGFANLPNQVYRKAVKRGFEFTLMVVGM